MTSGREEIRTSITSICYSTLDRRQFLRRGVALGLTVPAFSALLSACEVNIGVDDDDDEPTAEADEDGEVDQDDNDAGDESDAGEGTDDEPDDDEDDDDDDDESAADGDVPELDLETLEAETPDGTLQVQRAENSYVGEIDDGRVIGIAFSSEVDIAEDPYDEEEIVVRLYDRQESAVFRGDIDEDGAASLESFDGSDFEASVDLVMEDDVVTGTVTFGDEEEVSFTAEEATGDAGLYWVENTDEDAEIKSVDWVVLPDGRQWGVICIPPTFNNPFCGVRRL